MPTFAIGERDDYSGTKGINFVSGDLRLITTGHQEGMLADDGLYTQTFWLIATGSDPEAEIIELDVILRMAVEYHNEQNDQIIAQYLHETTPDEPGATAGVKGGRVALITGYKLTTPPSNMIHGHLREHSTDIVMQLAITRQHFEEQGLTTLAAMGDIAADGGSHKNLLTADGGSLPSRIKHFEFTPRPGDAIGKVWIGIRSDGNVAPRHGLGSASPIVIRYGNTIIKFNDASYGGADVSETPFTADTDMKFRLSKRLNGSAEFLTGQHTLLLMCKTTDANTEVRARLSLSWEDPIDAEGSGLNQAITLGEFVFSDGLWQVYDLGVHRLSGVMPRLDIMDLMGAAQPQINIEAERTAGTGKAFWGTYVILGADHRLHIDQANASDDHVIHIVTADDFQVDVISIDSAFNMTKPSVTHHNWIIPQRGGWMGMVLSRQASFENSDLATAPEFRVHHSWRGYRD